MFHHQLVSISQCDAFMEIELVASFSQFLPFVSFHRIFLTTPRSFSSNFIFRAFPKADSENELLVLAKRRPIKSPGLLHLVALRRKNTSSSDCYDNTRDNLLKVYLSTTLNYTIISLATTSDDIS